MKIINVTPHAIYILSTKGVIQDSKTKTYSANASDIEILQTIPKSGILPRVASSEVEAGEILGIPILVTTWGEISDLPPEEDGIFYIVSSIVASAAKAQGRKDCLAPLKLVRDEANSSTVLGCLALGI